MPKCFKRIETESFTISEQAQQEISSAQVSKCNSVFLIRPDILSTSDLLTRGIDIQAVNVVINFGKQIPPSYNNHPNNPSQRFPQDGRILST